MSLRDLAAADCQRIVENNAEFGWPITVTSPDGVAVAMVGLSSDVSLTIDPETGQVISGRKAHVSLIRSSLLTAFGAEPRAIADERAKPWLVRFNDINGLPHQFKVLDTLPDRAFGKLILTLEGYRASLR